MQGCHNSGESITVVPEVKRYVRKSKPTNDNYKQQRRRTDTLRETLRDGQMFFFLHGGFESIIFN